MLWIIQPIASQRSRRTVDAEGPVRKARVGFTCTNLQLFAPVCTNLQKKIMRTTAAAPVPPSIRARQELPGAKKCENHLYRIRGPLPTVHKPTTNRYKPFHKPITSLYKPITSQYKVIQTNTNQSAYETPARNQDGPFCILFMLPFARLV